MTRLAAVLPLLALLPAGCWLPREIGSARYDMGVFKCESELRQVASEGEIAGIEVSIGGEKGEDLRMGPVYFTLALSSVSLNGSAGRIDSFGFRARSSMLERCTRSYPYAAVGVYGGQLAVAGKDSRLGLGVEGGYGVRIGLGPRAALDIEALLSFGYYEGRFDGFSWRYGMAMSVLWGETW